MKLSLTTISAGTIVGFLSAFVLPIQSFLIFTISAVFVDMVTGMLASAKKGDKIQSKKIGHTIIKLIQFLSIILISHYFSKVYLNDNDLLVYTVSGVIALKEMISIYENVSGSTGVDLTSIFKRFTAPLHKELDSNTTENND